MPVAADEKQFKTNVINVINVMNVMNVMNAD